jgi:ABC-type uncharacterized transport system involved in gliding motility auxiliary subunit
METALRFCGYIGSILILFGILGGVIVGSFIEQPLLFLHLLVGVLCIGAWAVTSGVKSLTDARQVVTGRTARFGFNAALYTAVFVGLLVVANIFVILHEKRWDLTEQGVYSLSDKSAKIVAGLQKPVKMYALDMPQVVDKNQTRDLLSLYKLKNDKMVSFEILDPRARPVEVDRLGMKSGNLLYIEYGEGASKVINRLNEIDEQSITNALIKLTRGASRRLYYVQGHGEPSLESGGAGGLKDFVDALGDEHISIEGLLLPQTGSVPQDAAAVILVAPKKPLAQSERDALVEYGRKGGRLVLLGNTEDQGSDDVRAIAKEFGIEVGNDVVLDEQLKLFSAPEVGVQFLAQNFGAHPITAGMSKAQPVVFSFSSSVMAPKETPKGGRYTELLKSGPNSWAEKNLQGLFNPEGATAARDPEDIKGPVSIAVAYEKEVEEASPTSGEEKFKNATRVVVFGDSTWIENGNLTAMGNRDVALNSVNWVTGEEGGVAIGPKSLRASVAPIPQATYNIMLAMSFLGPELILLFGLFIWWRRRESLA